MPYLFFRSIGGLIALAAAAALLPASSFAGSNEDVVASLRVLTPSATLESGASYVTDTESLKTDPNARCFVGGVGGSGDRVKLDGPNALGLVRSALDWNAALDPISVTDEFGFGLGVCGFGGKKANENRYWSLSVNHLDPGVGGEQVHLDTGDQVLWYLTSYPPPPELEITEYPSGTSPNAFQVSVVEHSCTTDPSPPYETHCSASPVQNAAVTGGQGLPALTDEDGHASIPAGSNGSLTLQATKGDDIPSAPVKVCVNESGAACPSSPGLTIYGRDVSDHFGGSAGWDKIKAGDGKDRIDITQGGEDRVNCGGGNDKVLVATADEDDQIANNCERVARV
jgi:hypothetical protein